MLTNEVFFFLEAACTQSRKKIEPLNNPQSFGNLFLQEDYSRSKGKTKTPKLTSKKKMIWDESLGWEFLPTPHPLL